MTTNTTNTTIEGSEEHHELDVTPLLFVWMCLIVGYLFRYVTRQYSRLVPYTVWLMIIGAILSALAEHTKILGLWGDGIQIISNIDPHIILHVFLPALIFESAFNVNFHILWREAGQAVVLAGPGVIISSALCALLAKYMFPYEWSTAYSFLFGAIVSATDPVAVVSTLREVGASKRLGTLIEAESLLNDGTAFVLFIVILDFVHAESNSLLTEPDTGKIAETFIRLSFGGVGFGIACGMVAAILLGQIFNDAIGETVITISACYLVFWLAEASAIKVSGVLAVVTLGLYLSKNRTVISPQIEENLTHVWEMIGYIANTIIFILSGVIVGTRIWGHNKETAVGFSDAGYLIAFFILLQIVRLVTVGVCTPFLKRLGYGFSISDLYIVTWGGLRGAVGLSLALIVEGDGDIPQTERSLLMFHVAGVVALSLIVNGSTMQYLLYYLRYAISNPSNELVYDQAIKHLRHEENLLMLALKQDQHYSGADWRKIRGSLPAYRTNYMAQKEVDGENEKEEFSGNLKDKHLDRTLTVVNSNSSNIELQPAQLQSQSELHLQQDDSLVLEEIELQRETKPTHLVKAEIEQLMQELQVTANLEDRKKLFEKVQKLVDNQLKDLQMEEHLTREVRHRLLSSIKANLWGQFDEGKTTRKAVALLVEACETALDCDNFSPMYQSIEPYIVIPKYLRSVENWISDRHTIFNSTWLADVCRSYIRRLMFNRLSLGVEIAMAFIAAFERVKDIMITFPELAKDEARIIGDILEEVEKYEGQVRRYWMDVRLSYPEVYRAIQTRQGAQRILFNTRVNIDKLYTQGLLEESEKEKLTELVNHRMHSVQNTSNFATKLSTGIEILLELPFLTHLNNVSRQRIVKIFRKHTYNAGDTILKSMSYAKSLVVVVRGIIDLYIKDENGNEKVVENLDVGRLLGLWSVLSDSVYRAEARARGPVEVFRLPARFVKQLCAQDSKIDQRFWKMAGAGLMKVFFQREFFQLSRVSLAKMCEDSMYMKLTNDTSHRLQLMSTALLLRGEVRSYQIDEEDDSDVISISSSAVSSPRKPSQDNDNNDNNDMDDDIMRIKKQRQLSNVPESYNSNEMNNFDDINNHVDMDNEDSRTEVLSVDINSKSYDLGPKSKSAISPPEIRRQAFLNAKDNVEWASHFEINDDEEDKIDEMHSLVVTSRNRKISRDLSRLHKRKAIFPSKTQPNLSSTSSVHNEASPKSLKQSASAVSDPNLQSVPIGINVYASKNDSEACVNFRRDENTRQENEAKSNDEDLSEKKNIYEENTSTLHAPAMLYPTHDSVEYVFSPGSILLVFRPSDILKVRAEEQHRMEAVKADPITTPGAAAKNVTTAMANASNNSLAAGRVGTFSQMFAGTLLARSQDTAPEQLIRTAAKDSNSPPARPQVKGDALTPQCTLATKHKMPSLDLDAEVPVRGIPAFLPRKSPTGRSVTPPLPKLTRRPSNVGVKLKGLVEPANNRSRRLTQDGRNVEGVQAFKNESIEKASSINRNKSHSSGQTPHRTSRSSGKRKKTKSNKRHTADNQSLNNGELEMDEKLD